MLEYSLVLWLACGALFVGAFFPYKDSSSHRTQTVFQMLMEAYQTYNDSYYFALCAPMP